MTISIKIEIGLNLSRICLGLTSCVVPSGEIICFGVKKSAKAFFVFSPFRPAFAQVLACFRRCTWSTGSWMPVFWRLLFGGNVFRKTAVDYISLDGATYVGATSWDWEIQALKRLMSTMQRGNQLQVVASIGAATMESATSDTLADKMLVRAMHATSFQMQKDFLSVQFAPASAHGLFSPQSEAHS